jgi:hypothetical protein
MPSEESRNINIRRPGRSLIAAGAVAGLGAGILMAVCEMIYAGFRGAGIWLPFRSIAGTFYGPMALVGNPGVIIIGILEHLAIAAVLGIVFVTLSARGRSSGSAFWNGVLYGTAVWAVMTYVLLPVFNSTMRARVMLMPVSWLFLHWIYGGLLGLFTRRLRGAAMEPPARLRPSEPVERRPAA